MRRPPTRRGDLRSRERRLGARKDAASQCRRWQSAVTLPRRLHTYHWSSSPESVQLARILDQFRAGKSALYRHDNLRPRHSNAFSARQRPPLHEVGDHASHETGSPAPRAAPAFLVGASARAQRSLAHADRQRIIDVPRGQRACVRRRARQPAHDPGTSRATFLLASTRNLFLARKAADAMPTEKEITPAPTSTINVRAGQPMVSAIIIFNRRQRSFRHPGVVSCGRPRLGQSRAHPLSA